jgi:endonuclease YncB( thermonuclease family)
MMMGMGSIFFGQGCTRPDPPGYKPTCRGAYYISKEKIRFKDGDTILLDGKPIRFLGVDTPEVIDSTVGIFENQPYGPEAAESTRVWIMRAATAEYLPDGKDVYGRRLAHIFVDGELLAVRLIRCGLAYETVSWYGDNGFPDQAREILEASEDAPKPKFQKPSQWRRKHQKRRGRRD